MIARAIPLAAALLLSACSVFQSPEITAIDSSAARLSPFEASYSEGKRLLRADRPGLAAVMFAKACAIDPASVAALNAAGAAFDELHAPQLAAPYYARAIALEPASPDTLNNMALSALLAGRPDDASALFRRALAADPGNPTILANQRLLAAPPYAPPHEPPTTAPGPRIERSGIASLTLIMAGKAGPNATHLTGDSP